MVSLLSTIMTGSWAVGIEDDAKCNSSAQFQKNHLALKILQSQNYHNPCILPWESCTYHWDNLQLHINNDFINLKDQNDKTSQMELWSELEFLPSPLCHKNIFFWPSHCWPIILTSGTLSDQGLSRVHLPHQDPTQVFQFLAVDEILLFLCYQDTRSTAAVSLWQNDQNEIFQLNTLTRLKPLRKSGKVRRKVIKGLKKATRRPAIYGSFSWSSGLSSNASDHLNTAPVNKWTFYGSAKELFPNLRNINLNAILQKSYKISYITVLLQVSLALPHPTTF